MRIVSYFRLRQWRDESRLRSARKESAPSSAPWGVRRPPEAPRLRNRTRHLFPPRYRLSLRHLFTATGPTVRPCLELESWAGATLGPVCHVAVPPVVSPGAVVSGPPSRLTAPSPPTPSLRFQLGHRHGPLTCPASCPERGPRPALIRAARRVCHRAVSQEDELGPQESRAGPRAHAGRQHPHPTACPLRGGRWGLRGYRTSGSVPERQKGPAQAWGPLAWPYVRLVPGPSPRSRLAGALRRVKDLNQGHQVGRDRSEEILFERINLERRVSAGLCGFER